jgi:hypothetical protein
VLEPKPLTITDDAQLAAMVKVPDGFTVEVVGREMGNTRMLAVHGEHTYATRRTEGDVIRLDDGDGDGKFEGFTTVASRAGMHPLAAEFERIVSVFAHMGIRLEPPRPPERPEEEITFLYKLLPGACPRSYGVNVARLAGLPAVLLRRAEAKAREMEACALAAKRGALSGEERAAVALRLRA